MKHVVGLSGLAFFRHHLTQRVNGDVFEDLKSTRIIDILRQILEGVRLKGKRPSSVRLPVVVQVLEHKLVS